MKNFSSKLVLCLALQSLLLSVAFAQEGKGRLEGKYIAGANCDDFGVQGDTVIVAENVPGGDPDLIPQNYLQIAFSRIVPLNEQTTVELQYSNGQPFTESGLELSVGNVSAHNMGDGSELSTGDYSPDGSSFKYQYIEFTGGQKHIQTTIAIASTATGLDIVTTDSAGSSTSCHLQN
jgi:hypothetical protein